MAALNITGSKMAIVCNHQSSVLSCGHVISPKTVLFDDEYGDGDTPDTKVELTLLKLQDQLSMSCKDRRKIS